MAIPNISPIPAPPSTTNPEQFNARADAFLAALPVLQQQLNAMIDALNPLVPSLPGLDKIVANLEAIKLTGANIAQVNATGTNIVSVNAVAIPAKNGSLQLLADATGAMRALAPVAVELAELATHLADLSTLADKTAELLKAVAEIQAIVSAVSYLAELVAVGDNIAAILGVYANLNTIAGSQQAAVEAAASSYAAKIAQDAAEKARDAAKGFADAASAITGLPVASENNAPLVWNAAAKRWIAGSRIDLSTPDRPGLVTADNDTLMVDRGVLRIKPQISVDPVPGSLAMRDASGNLPSAIPIGHAATHGSGGSDQLTLAAMGYTVSIPAAPNSLAMRNEDGMLEGKMRDPQKPETHAASHSQEGTDPVTLEAIGVTISASAPSGTFSRLWIQYF